MHDGGIHAPPLDPPQPTLITMFLTTTPTSRFGFSMMWGKFCRNCFEITARTAQGRWKVGARAPLYFFSPPPIEILNPPSALPFKNL